MMEYYEGTIFMRQSTFFRVNCLDCLDRTNVIQFKASEKMIGLFQKAIN